VETPSHFLALCLSIGTAGPRRLLRIFDAPIDYVQMVGEWLSDAPGMRAYRSDGTLITIHSRDGGQVGGTTSLVSGRSI
jgi:hypothetical protein